MRVLFLTHRLPYAPNKGDRLRAYHILRTLQEHADVELVSLVHGADEAAQAKPMEGPRLHVTTIPVSRTRRLLRVPAGVVSGRSLTHVLLDASHARATIDAVVTRTRPDVVLAFCSGVGQYVLEPSLAGMPCVVDLVDVDSAKWRDLAQASGWPMSAVYAREARLIAETERALAARASAVLVVNEREADAFRDVAPNAQPAVVVPNGVDRGYFTPAPQPATAPTVIFTGVMDYAPNARGILWFTQHVWPKVLAARPDAQLSVVGASPGPEIRALARSVRGVTVTGTVPGVREYLWNAAVAVAPLQVARGVQNKVLEAVATGVPCVITRAVANGVPERVLPACVVEDSPEGMAGAIVSMLARSALERRTIATRASLEGLDWPGRVMKVVSVLQQAATRKPSGLAD